MLQPETTSGRPRPDLFELQQEYDWASMEQMFIADAACPPIPTPTRNGTYYIWNRETLRQVKSDTRSPEGAFNRVQHLFGNGTFDCVSRGLEEPIDRETESEFATLFSADEEARNALRHHILLAREKRVADLYADAGFTETGAATAWSSSGSAVPLTDIKTGIDSLTDSAGVAAQQITMIIPLADYNELITTDQVNDKVKYTYARTDGIQPAYLPADTLAGMLGIRRVVVGDASYNAAGQGLTASISRFWTAGTIYLAVLAEPDNPSRRAMSAFRRYYWQQFTGQGGAPYFEEYPEYNTDSRIIRARLNDDPVQTAETDLMVYALSSDA